MNELLQSKQSALAKARAAQSAALQASRARSRGAAATRSPRSRPSRRRPPRPPPRRRRRPPPTPRAAPTGPALGADSGWAIPWAIVDCESGGQNFPPNSAGASGYYQIIPSTWQEYGGTGPAAYLTSKAEQSAVAKRIWDGAGPGAWDCASIVGIIVIATGIVGRCLSTTVQTPTDAPGSTTGRPDRAVLLRGRARWCSRSRCASPSSRRPRFTSIDDASTYNRLGALIAQLGDYKPEHRI